MKEFFTTGEVARICKTSPKTIVNYCESGLIDAEKSQVTNYRRIPRAALLRFMKRYQIPEENLLAFERRRVLVVDDDPSVLAFVRETLEDAGGYDVLTAADGYEALIAIGARRPDLLVLDIRMPKMDGFEVCRNLRANPLTRDLRILAITGVSDEDTRRRILEAGADRCLLKPIDPALLQTEAGAPHRRTRRMTPPGGSPAPARRPAMDHARILVVDHEPETRAWLRAELEREGYRVAEAASGAEAVETARADRFDAVILDMHLPGMNGLQVLDRIREADPEAALIAAGANPTVEAAVECMRRGASDYIQKPYASTEILLVLERALEKRRLRELVSLYEASLHIFGVLRPQDLYPKTIEAARSVLGADEASLMLVEPDGRLRLAVWAGLPAEASHAAPIAPGEGIAGRVAQHRRPLLLVDQGAGDPELRDLVRRHDLRSAVSLPLVLGDRLLGVLNASRRIGRPNFTQGDLRKAVILGAHVALAVENARLYRELEDKITSLNEARNQLVQSEKLAAIGQFVSGVAHELNNPLTGVLGYSQLLIDADGARPVRHLVEKIYREGLRCRKIVQNLLNFARWNEPKKRPISINEVLEATLDLRAYQLRVDNIEVVRELASGIPPVMGDPHQLQQVFINLINNAHEAMRAHAGRGRLVIRTEADGATVRVSFLDNGPGIPPAVIGRIFDPFFTTKEVGKGTGLGLSVSYGLIREHGGRIVARSEYGAGATFVVELPAGGTIGAETPRNAQQPPRATAHKPGKILVVDDEPVIADLWKCLLEEDGNVVDVALTGTDGLRLIDGGGYDLVISDLKIPGIGGKEILRHILAKQPRLARRVVFSTGDSLNADSTEFLRSTGCPCISKPFDIGKVRRLVARLLAEEGRADGWKFLVADDDRQARDLVRQALRDHLGDAVTVLEAGDGESALARVRQDRPHVAICGLKMPGMDGLSLLRRMKALFPDLPVVVLAAPGDPAEVQSALAAGADEYVAKPVRIEEFRRVVGRVLERARQPADAESESFLVS
jgi:CheY-like chemotaxis protein/signal transduction histidine kinase